MKKLVTLLILCSGLFISCYDDTALIERIDALEKTTIVALQTSITTLEAKYAELKEHIVPSSEIENKISELKEWMEKLINGYYTKEEIDQQLELLNTEIEALETLINGLTGDFDIEFDNNNIGILAGGTTSIDYTIIGATEKTIVKALGQNGWSAKVTPDGTDKGKITVTAPDPLTEDEIVVLVYDGEYRTIMSSINFVTGVVTPSQPSVELEAEAGTVDITVTSNLNYTVSIPEDAKSWLSVVETKATKTETVTFAYTECVGSIRKATVSFKDEANNTISSMTFIQQGSAVEVTIINAGTLLETIGEDLYQDVMGLVINGPLNGDDFRTIDRMGKLKFLDISNASIVSGGGSYRNFLDKDYFTEDNKIGELMFCIDALEEIILPINITHIGYRAFDNCDAIHTVKMYDKVTHIGGSAFASTKLKEINLSKSLEEIGNQAFINTPIKEITFPITLKKIGSDAFYGCEGLKHVEIPQNVQQIGDFAFQFCILEHVYIKGVPSVLQKIGGGAFRSSYETATLHIPIGTLNEYKKTALGNFKTIVEESF